MQLSCSVNSKTVYRATQKNSMLFVQSVVTACVCFLHVASGKDKKENGKVFLWSKGVFIDKNHCYTHLKDRPSPVKSITKTVLLMKKVCSIENEILRNADATTSLKFRDS